ncbi:MAG: beta-lactamase family protein [Clostridia bacterium]|nr:beta-lactamase family protein [Clostridia bacterium]
MRAKRLIAAILTALTLFTSACGSSSAPAEDASAAESVSEPAVSAAADARTEPASEAEPDAEPDALPDRTGAEHVYSGFSDSAGEALAAIADRYGAVAVEAAYYGGGDEILSFSWGYADLYARRSATTDTKYRVASLSKLVTAVVFMAAEDRGLVDENEDISTYFGETCRNPYFPDAVITPAMLLSHTSSLEPDGETTYYRRLLSSYSSYQYLKPGTEYSYSNLGYGVVACLLERATDRPFNDLAKEFLFDPLGIDASYVYDELEDASDVGALYGEGGLSVSSLADIKAKEIGQGTGLAYGNLIISAKDYVKILSMLIHRGVSVDGKTVLSAESVEKLLQLRIETDDYGVAFGSQIQTGVIGDDVVYVHTGSACGMFSAFLFDPQSDRAVVILTVGEPRWLDPETEVYRLCLDLIRRIWEETGGEMPNFDIKPGVPAFWFE